MARCLAGLKQKGQRNVDGVIGFGRIFSIDNCIHIKGLNEMQFSIFWVITIGE